MDGTLSSKARERRTRFFIFASVCLFVLLLNFASSFSMQVKTPIYLAGTVFSLIGFSIAVCAVLCRFRLNTHLVVRSLYLVTCGVLLWDISARTVLSVQWPLLVLIIDMLLVMQVPARYSLGLVCFIVLWLLLLGVEESFRFGLFELPGMPGQEGEYGRRYFSRLETDCSTLPCPVPFPSTPLISSVAVFVIDFIVTRGFAHEVLKEQASMERTINTVQEIASLLASYDVEKVAELLEAHRDELPEGMSAALRNLEENLRSYKAYLPQTCLLVDEEVVDEGIDVACTEPSVSSQYSSGSIRSTSMRYVPLGLSSVKATLLTVNMKDTLRFLDEDCALFSSFFTTLLLKTLQATESYRGMVDVFVGDKVHCSFNASRQCANNSISALRTASMLLRGSTSQVNIGVASGKVLRGEMGCDVMRRFSMVGTLVRDVHGMERAGRILGCDVLCNRMCFSDAECEHVLRLLPCKVDVSATCAEHEVVAELLLHDTPSDSPAEEWMYTIGRNSEWEHYNTAVRKYLRGDVSAAAVEEAAQGCPCSRSPLSVHPSTVKGGLLSVALARPLQDNERADGVDDVCYLNDS